ncbi:glycosyl transferase family 2 [Candidatus Woesearchaeota archaeon CG10_big_fil_rev_8_21_14_0_10_30_7]|nr:MAG: glycosyl transferase family 2 [Candidatus Woesearchaeota archaeon CG10_big_fil_rev_8_21_14_0_10_30_7]
MQTTDFNEKLSVSIIIPCYNEERSIKSTIQRLKETMNKSGVPYELIFVNDCSKDNTGLILNEHSSEITVLHHEINKGYGASLKTGISKAKYSWIAITDADGTYPIEELPRLINNIPKYDMVVGARTKKKAHIPLLRKPAKFFLNKLANYLSGTQIPDLNSGLRVFRKNIVERFITLFPEGFSFTTTLTMTCLTNDYKVKFIPIDYFKRKGKSSIKPIKDFVGFTQLIIRLALYFRPLNFFLPVSAFFFLMSLLLAIKDLFNYCSADFFTCRIGVFSALVFIFAIQTAFLGLLAELIIKRTKL